MGKKLAVGGRIESKHAAAVKFLMYFFLFSLLLHVMTTGSMKVIHICILTKKYKHTHTHVSQWPKERCT